MNSRRFLIGTLLAASFAAAAVGAIHIMKLRLRSDDVGARIQRLERSITESKKELDALKRARDQTQDSLQLKQIEQGMRLQRRRLRAMSKASLA